MLQFWLFLGTPSYVVHKVQMPLPGCCVSGGTLTQNYDATNMMPTQKDQPLLCQRGDPIYKHIDGLETNKNLVMGPSGARNEE
jgi:hypothetical protein